MMLTRQIALIERCGSMSVIARQIVKSHVFGGCAQRQAHETSNTPHRSTRPIRFRRSID